MKTLKNFAYNMGYQLTIILVSLALSPYLSRVVGPAGIGAYSYTYSVVTLFGIFANLGIAKYGNREIAKCQGDRERRSRVFGELLAIKGMGALGVLILYAGFVALFGGEYRQAFWIQTFNLISIMLDITWFFWGLQEFRVTAMVCSGLKLLSVVLVYTFVKDQGDTGIYIFVLATNALMIQLGPWFFLKRYIDFKIAFLQPFNRHWKRIILLFFPLFAKYLYGTLDRILLGNFSDLAQVGYYENVQSMIITFVSVMVALGDVLMPRMTLLCQEGRTKVWKQDLEWSFQLVSFLASGITFGVIGIAGTFVPFFYGEQFYPCIFLLRLAAPGVLLAGYSEFIRNGILLPLYRDREYVIALVMGAAANVVVNLLCIPRLAGTGAVMGALAAEGTILIIQLWFVRRELPWRRFLPIALIYWGLGAAIWIPCSLAEKTSLSLLPKLLVQLMGGGAVYLGGTVLYLWLCNRELFLFARKTVKEFIGKLH